MLFSVKVKNNSKKHNKDGFIYLLLEHQSKPDPLMALRLFKYMINICYQYLRTHPKKKQVLPLVYPLIIYNGKKRYNAARNLWDLHDNPALAKAFWTEDHQIVSPSFKSLWGLRMVGLEGNFG